MLANTNIRTETKIIGVVDLGPRARPVRGPNAVAAVQHAVDANPHTSTRTVARLLGMSQSSVHRTIKHSLGMHPFKRHHVQELRDGDEPRRLDYCEWVLEQVNNASLAPHPLTLTTRFFIPLT